MAVATHPHHRISKRWHVADVKKLHWTWPGNPNGRSKFHNLGLFTFTWSQLTLRRRLRGWWRLPDRSNGTLPMSKTLPAMTRIYRTSTDTKIYAYEIKQSVSNNIFLMLRTTPRMTALHTVYFPAITCNGFCFHIRTIISRRLWPPPKNRDINIVEFFVDSIYSKTIDIIRNKILYF